MADLKQGDIVLILYNNTIGRIERIHNWGPLYDVIGIDGFKYSNQFASELVPIMGLNKTTLERLAEWISS